MSASVGSFIEKRATVEIVAEDGSGDKTTVVYRPNLLNPKFFRKLDRYAENEDVLGAARILCNLIVEWDLKGELEDWIPVLDDDGEPTYDDDGEEVGDFKVIVPAGDVIPLKPEIVAALPNVVTSKIFEAISENASPKATTKQSRRSRRR